MIKGGRVSDARNSHNDNIVFNCLFKNFSDTQEQELYFTNTRNESIIKAGTMYYTIVDSFEIPNEALPIFRWDNTGVPLTDPPNVAIPTPVSAYRHKYHITFDTSLADPNDVLYTIIELEERGRGSNISSVSQLIDSINESIQNNTTDRFGNNVALLDSDIEFIYNPIVNEYPYLVLSTTSRIINIYFSTSLMNLFQGFDNTFIAYNSNNMSDNQVLRTTAILDTINSQYIFQRFGSYYNWSDVRNILITTHALPIVEENFTNNPSTNADEKTKIVSDFTPFRVSGSNFDKSPWQYRTDYPKLIDIRSDIAIDRIDFAVIIQYKDGTTSRLRIAPGSEAILKLRFVKRALYNNEYNLTDIDERVKQFGLLNHHY